jgi:hypothetical protein
MAKTLISSFIHFQCEYSWDIAMLENQEEPMFVYKYENCQHEYIITISIITKELSNA